MTEFMDFAARNWYLFAALFFFGAWLLAADLLQRRKGIISVESQKVVRLMNDDVVQVYDIRSIKEYQNGFISGAKHMDPANLENYTVEIQKSKKAPLIVCSRGAAASGIAAKIKKLGIEGEVYALTGGMLKWSDDKLPVVKK